MTGILREKEIEKVVESSTTMQQSLDDFSINDDPTTVAILSQNFGQDCQYEVDKLCDEWYPSLSLPEYCEKRYMKYMDGYLRNSAVDDPYERAYNDANVGHIYRNHIRNSEKAQSSIKSIVDMLDDDIDVTLVTTGKKIGFTIEIYNIILSRIDGTFTLCQQ